MESKLTEYFLELIRKTSTDLSRDVEDRIKLMKDQEAEGSSARSALEKILDNIEIARKESVPMCQDTGALLFYIKKPAGIASVYFEKAAKKAAEMATQKSYLRPNAVDSITGKNSGNNVGHGLPYLNISEHEKNTIDVTLMLKGGGSENVGIQYTLPDNELKAGRDLNGIKKCIINACVRAQGKGCAPGILGIGIGGDRASSYALSKKQLLRFLDDKNSDPELAAIEDELFDKINSLGIGPMGFGGKTTILGLKVGKYHRLPASFFVSVSYMCWASRRRSVSISM